MPRFGRLQSLFATSLFLVLYLFAQVANALGGVNAVAFRDIAGAGLGPRGFIDYIPGVGTHLGNDVYTGPSGNWTCGGTVYSPGYGTVELVENAGGTYPALGNAVMIKHAGMGRGGSNIFSIVLHLQENPLVGKGQVVTPYTILGHVGKTGGANDTCHAHIELRYFSEWLYPKYNNIYALNSNESPRDATRDVDPKENWENPDTYTLNIIPPSNFDGVGSLVDPANGGTCNSRQNFGCSADLVRLHAHENPSTGVFQVVSQKDRCEYVRLEGLSSAIIGVKRWDETYPRNPDGLSTVYRANTLPVSFRLPVDKWMLVSVTTTQAIPSGEIRDVKLRCLTYPEYLAQPTNPGGLSDIAPPLSDRPLYPDLMLVKFGADFHWSGSGSLITFSGSQLQIPNTYEGFGRNKDMAIKFSARKSLLAFQIFSDGTNCRIVRVSSASGSSNGTLVEASVKQWASKYWGAATTATLPFNFSLPAGSDYWILKLKPATVGTDNLRVDCL